MPDEPALHLPYRGAPMGAALRRYWTKGLTFTGRASPAEYWKSTLVYGGGLIALYLLLFVAIVVAALMWEPGEFLFTQRALEAIMWLNLGALAFALVLVVPGMAVTVRRLHDADRSGAYVWLYLVPLVGGIIVLILLVLESRPEGARFDRTERSVR